MPQSSTNKAVATTHLTLQRCTVLGSAGYQIPPGEQVTLIFSSARMLLDRADGTCFSIPLLEIDSIDVSGPGAVKSGGGFVGGGFGVEGAIEGIAIATVLNALTSKSSTHTLLSFITNVGELHLHYQGMEPGALRVAMAPVYVALRALNADWMARRVSVLESALQRGTLSAQRHVALLARLTSSSTHVEEPAKSVGGRCPSCKKAVPISAERCGCGALFVGDTLWRVEVLDD